MQDCFRHGFFRHLPTIKLRFLLSELGNAHLEAARGVGVASRDASRKEADFGKGCAAEGVDEKNEHERVE